MHVSVGIPVYNGATGISRALLSLRQQSHANIEIVVVDNCSTDATREIVNSHAKEDDRIRLVEFAHAPAATNFKRALDESSGDFFMWGAHDDLWHPTFIERSLDALGNTFDYCSPNWWVGGIDNYVGSSLPRHPLEFISDPSRRGRVLSFINLHHSSHKCNIVYALFRRELIEEAHSRRDISDDGALGATICSLSRGATTQDALFYKDYGSPGQATSNLRRKISGRLNRIRPAPPFEEQRMAASQELERLFPEYSGEIRQIFGKYEEFTTSMVLDAEMHHQLMEARSEALP